MNRINLTLIIAIVVTVLLEGTIIAIIYYNGLSSNSPSTATPTPVSIPTPTLTPKPITTITPNSTSTPTTTPNSKLTATYLEASRNESMIVIDFKVEPNSYLFPVNASSFYLVDSGLRISANTNDFVIIGTQYSTLFFSINNYYGTDYHLSSDVLPSDTIWIRQ